MSYEPPKKNAEYISYLGLLSQTTGQLQVNPTIAAGDFKVSTDGGAFANLTTLPVVTPAGGRAVKLTLSAAEMNGDNVVVQCVDAAGAEWSDQLINLQPSVRQIDDLAYPATPGTNVENAVWDVPIAGHLTAGSTGASLNAAGSAGDPWATALPGVYVSGAAGNILGNLLTTALPDSVPAVGTIPSVGQALYMLAQFHTNRLNDPDTLTVTVYKADGTTALYTLQMNSATEPTGTTRTT